jgi:hypothetical protein
LYFDAELKKGDNQLRIESNDTLNVDMISVYDLPAVAPYEIFSSTDLPAKINSINKISPSKYVIQVNASEPYVLAFAEAYNPLWVATINSATENSIPMYSTMNGFVVNETGEHVVTIQYLPQLWLIAGAITSLMSLGVLFYYGYLTRRRSVMVINERIHENSHSARQAPSQPPQPLNVQRLLTGWSYLSFIACLAISLLFVAVAAEILNMTEYAETVAQYSFFLITFATILVGASKVIKIFKNSTMASTNLTRKSSRATW